MRCEIRYFAFRIVPTEGQMRALQILEVWSGTSRRANGWRIVALLGRENSLPDGEADEFCLVM